VNRLPLVSFPDWVVWIFSFFSSFLTVPEWTAAFQAFRRLFFSLAADLKKPLLSSLRFFLLSFGLAGLSALVRKWVLFVGLLTPPHWKDFKTRAPFFAVSSLVFPFPSWGFKNVRRQFSMCLFFGFPLLIVCLPLPFPGKS